MNPNEVKAATRLSWLSFLGFTKSMSVMSWAFAEAVHVFSVPSGHNCTNGL